MSIHELLAQLQKTYLASVGEKIALIGQLWDKRDYDLLETEYHKLKGTGRTYGLPEFTQIGAALERLCEAHREGLPRAVPVSLELMAKARDARNAGQVLSLEDDSEWRAVLALVETANAKAS